MKLKDVLDEYNSQKSIRSTAVSLNISESVVRKVLVTYRVVDTPLIRRIAELRAAGMPSNDIADLLKISKSCVGVNTPYSRGTYLIPSKTPNAVNIRKWRKRKTDDEIKRTH